MTVLDQIASSLSAEELLELLAAAESAAPQMKHLRTAANPGAFLQVAAIADAPRVLSGGQLSDSTQENYLRALQRFRVWAEERGVRDLHDWILSLYLGYLYRQGVSASTAVLAGTALTCLAKHLMRPSPVGPYTRIALSCYRRQVPCGCRGPAGLVSRAEVRAAARAADTGSDLGYRDAALLFVAFDGLLRSSEAAALKVQDLEWQKPDSVRLHVRARNGQTGRCIRLRPSTIRRLRRWLNSPFSLPAAPLFPRMDAWHWALGKITRQGINQIVRNRFGAIGIKGISAQSLRAGGARALAMDGASIAEIQAAGGWSSPTMPTRYGRFE